MISQAELKRLFRYDEETGLFYRRMRSGVYRLAGGERKNSYWRIAVKNKRYYAHRLAWFYVYGYWPDQIDHKDRNKINNAISNLREATFTQNNANRIVTGMVGLKGVSKRTENCYSARITVNGKVIRLGHFKTPKEAHAAYVKAAEKYFGEFARP